MLANSVDEPITKHRLADEEEEGVEVDEWEDKFSEDDEPEAKGKRKEEDELEDFSLFEDWEEEYA